AHLSKSRLEMGYRLACNLPVTGDTQVEVAGGAALWSEHVATVESVHAVTPFLREIVLAPETPAGPEFQPGAYLQVKVPAYSLKAGDIARPDAHHPEWSSLALPDALASKAPVRRSYSLSLPAEQVDGKLVVLVRFMP